MDQPSEAKKHLKDERLMTTQEVARLLAVSHRKVLMLPLKQIRLGPRIIRYRERDIIEFIGLDSHGS